MTLSVEWGGGGADLIHSDNYGHFTVNNIYQLQNVAIYLHDVAVSIQI